MSGHQDKAPARRAARKAVTVATIPQAVARANGDGDHAPSLDDRITEWAANSAIDADKLDKLWTIYEKQLATRARIEHAEAMAAAQADFPIVGRDAHNPHTNSNYARFETIWETCAPIWTRHGLSVSFPAVTTPEGKIRMTARIRHRSGHIEEIGWPDADSDTTGARGAVNKTFVQGNQSAVSYMKRGLLCSAMGIATANEDDDGHAAKRPATGGERREPPAEDIDGYRPIHSRDTWIGTVERALAKNAGDGGKWMRLFKDACERCGTLGDAVALRCLSGVATALTTAPGEIRRVLEAELGNMDRRLARGTVGEHPSDEPGPTRDDGTASGFRHEAVVPPQNAGRPSWSTWARLVRDELLDCPPDMLEGWLDANRANIEACPEDGPLSEVLLALSDGLAAAELPAPFWLRAVSEAMQVRQQRRMS